MHFGFSVVAATLNGFSKAMRMPSSVRIILHHWYAKSYNGRYRCWLITSHLDLDQRPVSRIPEWFPQHSKRGILFSFWIMELVLSKSPARERLPRKSWDTFLFVCRHRFAILVWALPPLNISGRFIDLCPYKWPSSCFQHRHARPAIV